MRRYPLILLATLLPLAAAPAWAQFADAKTALTTSPLGSMSCGQFSRLAAPDRDAIVRKMNAEAPMSSLSTGVGSDIHDRNGNLQPRPNLNSVAGTPLTAGALVGYCQRVGAQSSLRDAFSFANSGQNTPFLFGR